MKVYVDLTDNELRALRSAIWNGIGACSGSCIYTEMQMKKTECSNCAYVKALDSLREKFNKPKSLTDYTKQVRKEVCDNFRKIAMQYYTTNDKGNLILTCNDVWDILSKLQGEDK